MTRSLCPTCGLNIYGTHATEADCIRDLRPRYEALQRMANKQARDTESVRQQLDRARLQLAAAIEWRKEVERENGWLKAQAARADKAQEEARAMRQSARKVKAWAERMMA